MTREELENNYEFKVTKKALMREFPFIKDVTVKKDDDINKYPSSIYLELVIDPYVMAHQYGFRVWDAVTRSLKKDEPYWFPYLSIFVENDNRMELVAPITKAIEELIDGIHKSPALPSELRLGKKLRVGSYMAYPSSLPSNMTD